MQLPPVATQVKPASMPMSFCWLSGTTVDELQLTIVTTPGAPAPDTPRTQWHLVPPSALRFDGRRTRTPSWRCTPTSAPVYQAAVRSPQLTVSKVPVSVVAGEARREAALHLAAARWVEGVDGNRAGGGLERRSARQRDSVDDRDPQAVAEAVLADRVRAWRVGASAIMTIGAVTPARPRSRCRTGSRRRCCRRPGNP